MAAEGNKEGELVAQFMAIAGVDAERALFFLESSGWNLPTAVSSFYETGEMEEEAAAEERRSGGGGGNVEELGERPEVEGAPSTPQRPPSQQRAIVNTMDHDSDSEDEGQLFYAGGSEQSGQQVLGPPRKKSDLVAKLFRSAKEHGAEVLEGPKDGKAPKATLTYSGTGYRLGENNDDTQVIPDTSARSSDRPRDVSLKMWRSGFTVDNGPLRAYDHPDNAQFLNSIRRSEVPLELVREARGGEVYINMADLRHEEYTPPKHSLKPFTGSGHTLGSPAPTVVGQTPIPPTPGAASGPPSAARGPTDTPETLEKKAKDGLSVRPDQPTTNIQLRLPDGSRLGVRVNHTHTLGDLRQYMLTARPQHQTQHLALMTTFPYAELKDDAVTIAEANLLNSAIVVKIK
ncbi:hypothetical protein Pcinc_015157 [Petrolisthes cinctipes]|uniref:Uncharacterized protein n=1 Tax=Petrolisthes cinctipes TaxID=88211 RepID=A0AAE1KQ19_PETCI|nr:hypothetical protein Pcinc_015157 [Petrolisthes cinctipes]